MFVGLLNALVKFKIGGSNQNSFPKTGILAYPVPIIMLIILYTFISSKQNVSMYFPDRVI